LLRSEAEIIGVLDLGIVPAFVVVSMVAWLASVVGASGDIQQS
jgi:hypothetical protein